MDGLLDPLPLGLQDATRRLGELRRHGRALLGLAAALIVVSAGVMVAGGDVVGISALVGSAAALALGSLKLVSRRRLLIALVSQGDAGALDEVAELADRISHDPLQRRRLADGLRAAAQAGRTGTVTTIMVDPARAADCAPRLLALADAFADERRPVSAPATALCRRLLSEGGRSPLYNTRLPEGDLERVLDAVENGVVTTPSDGLDRGGSPTVVS